MLLVCKNTIGFWILTLSPTTMLNSIRVSFLDFLGFFIVLVFPFQSVCIFFLALLDWLGLISTFPNRNSDYGHPSFISHLKRTALRISPLVWGLQVSFFHRYLLLCWKSFSQFLVCYNFFKKVMNGYWILSNAFSYSIEIKALTKF